MNTATVGRREFIGLSAAAFALSLKGADRPEYNFPTQPRERLAVSTYPFRSVVASPRAQEKEGNTGSMTLEQFAQTIVEKFDVTGIEPWSPHFKSTDANYVRGLSKSFRDAGLHVVNIPVDDEVHLCKSAEERKAGLARYREWVDAAVILGSPGIRVHLPHGESGNAISCSVAALKELAEYGASKNVVINLENDEPEIEQPERIARVINAVNSPFLRALPDFCNSMLIHNDTAYNYRAMSVLFPLAFNISHVKDSESDEGKVYRVDVNQIFAIGEKAGYRGYFSIEFEGEGDPYDGVKRLIDASLRNLS